MMLAVEASYDRLADHAEERENTATKNDAGEPRGSKENK